MGLDQNRAIEAEMDALLRAHGLTQGSVGERMTALGKDPKNLFPNNDAGRAQLLAYANGLITSVRPKLARAFNLKLKAPIQVKPVPVAIQDGAALGYMNPGRSTAHGPRSSTSTSNPPRTGPATTSRRSPSTKLFQATVGRAPSSWRVAGSRSFGC